MKRFKNILTAVNLARADRLVCEDLAPPTLEAIERSIWLAKLNSAQLTFFSTLDVSPAAQHRIEESEDDNSILGQAKQILGTLADRAKQEGIDAKIEVTFGKSWLEAIRYVGKNKIDLVVAGTRHLTHFSGVLLGTTGMKLLRKCPCPVWITEPQITREMKTVLVAHCLREVGDTAMEIGCAMAELNDSRLHIVHSLEIEEFDQSYRRIDCDETTLKARADAEAHIKAQLAKFQLKYAPEIHVVGASPDIAVLEQIDEHHVDCVVMGTVARTGIAGFITGNTAERILPQIRCSVLAVKPAGFESPIS